MSVFQSYRQVLVACILLAISQTGCVAGTICVPLWVAGTVTSYSGGVLTLAGLKARSPNTAALGISLVFIGAILGEENSNHAEALNEIPRDHDLAQKISVTIDDITDYNDNLNKIQLVGQQLVEDLKPLVKRLKKNEIDPKMVTSDSEINELARRYGFGSAAELMKTKGFKTLPQAYLESFAKATDLSVPHARIFLYHSFGIKTDS